MERHQQSTDFMNFRCTVIVGSFSGAANAVPEFPCVVVVVAAAAFFHSIHCWLCINAMYKCVYFTSICRNVYDF